VPYFHVVFTLPAAIANISKRGDSFGIPASENLHTKRLPHHGKWHRYSITSSARPSSHSGMVRPTFAVCMLMISSTFVAW
jgi:hypothetical protein